MEQPAQVASYYDKLWSEYDQTGASKPNARHYKIIKNLKSAGFKSGMKVLEIGCGVGSLSGMIIKALHGTGKFVGVDISSQTIELLKHRYKAANTDFRVTDMIDFSYPEKFDFIVFPDVLEHIPISSHDGIFKNLPQLCHPDTIIVINNPEPLMLEYVNLHRTDLLQIIDQPLHVDHICKLCYTNGFMIESITPYQLDRDQAEYQHIVIKMKSPLKVCTEQDIWTRKFHFLRLKWFH
jgi:trans-aconitate 2-methyltransferase